MTARELRVALQNPRIDPDSEVLIDTDRVFATNIYKLEIDPVERMAKIIPSQTLIPFNIKGE